MKFTEQNYPLFRYLKWSQRISQHPEMLRQRAVIGKNKVQTRLPFLNFQKKELVLSYGKDNCLAFDIRKQIYNDWPQLQDGFASKIEIISKNFFLALERSYDAFLKPELFEEIVGELQGTLILPDNEAVCYNFEMAFPHKDNDGKLRYAISGDALRIDQDGNRLVLAVNNDRAYDAVEGEEIDRQCEEAQGIFDMILVYTLFKKYAEVETVEAKSIKRPTKEQPELKTTINGIKYLDASWYTTIIRTEGFGVRGHFRLQPCGKNRLEKRMVYINEYQKKGYIRRAKLLTEKEKTE